MKKNHRHEPGQLKVLHSGQVATLVFDIWFESCSEAGVEGEWRGRVTNVLTNRTKYFRTLHKLEEVIFDLVPDLSENTAI